MSSRPSEGLLFPRSPGRPLYPNPFFLQGSKRVHRAVRVLGSHLGPILLQFPQSFKRDERRLADFLQMTQASNADLRLVCEFRHESWFTEEIYCLLHRSGVALCLADSPQYPRFDVLTADFIYYRLHGRTELFTSSYSVAELEHEAQQLQRHYKAGVDVYVYFNNTMHGHALSNARTLLALLGDNESKSAGKGKKKSKYKSLGVAAARGR